jgi:hypothetical protein
MATKHRLRPCLVGAEQRVESQSPLVPVVGSPCAALYEKQTGWTLARNAFPVLHKSVSPWRRYISELSDDTVTKKRLYCALVLLCFGAGQTRRAS